MFNGFDATLSGVTFRAKESKGAIRRSCELTVETDFSPELAKSFGSEAERWRDDLIAVAAEQIKIPISDLQVTAAFEAAEGGKHKVPMARGISAIGQACGADDEEPRIKIRLAFSLRNEDAAWFAPRLGEVVEVRLQKTQLSLLEPDGRQSATG